MTKRIPANIAFNYNPSADFKVQSISMKYCKKCGSPLILSAFNSDGSTNQFYQFEQENGIHYGCYQQVVAAEEAQQRLVEDKLKQIADAKADEAIERMIKENSHGHKPGTDK